MTPAAAVLHLLERGADLRPLRDGKISIKSESGTMTEELRKLLKDNKPLIRELLAQRALYQAALFKLFWEMASNSRTCKKVQKATYQDHLWYVDCLGPALAKHVYCATVRDFSDQTGVCMWCLEGREHEDGGDPA